MDLDLVEISVSNAILLFDLNGSKKMTLRLIRDSYHGDWKAKYPVLPKGSYEVLSIYSNCYGMFVRVKHNGLEYDIDPGNFEWYAQDNK